jgi:hypothetical protein
MDTILKSDGMQATSSCSCVRCNGFLVVEWVYHIEGYFLRQIRCVNCGWVCFEPDKRNRTCIQSKVRA